MRPVRSVGRLLPAAVDRVPSLGEEAGEALFANPRNLTAGTIKQLDVRDVARRRLDVVLYGLGFCEPALVASAAAGLLGTQSGLHGLFRAWGFPSAA